MGHFGMTREAYCGLRRFEAWSRLVAKKGKGLVEMLVIVAHLCLGSQMRCADADPRSRLLLMTGPRRDAFQQAGCWKASALQKKR